MYKEMNAYELSHAADVTLVSGDKGAGAEWLLSVQSTTLELLKSDDDVDDVATEEIPVYTSDKWNVFTDLAAYNEDTSDYDGGLDSLGSWALALIAERVVQAVKDDYENESAS